VFAILGRTRTTQVLSELILQSSELIILLFRETEERKKKKEKENCRGLLVWQQQHPGIWGCFAL
jgi:hypothetical protein